MKSLVINKMIARSDFTRNVLMLMTGTSIAQAIPVAISPILTRIYTPEDFGIFALFVSIVTVLSSVSSARYEMAIVLPHKDEEALNLVSLGFLITTIFSLLVLILVVLFNDKIASLLGNKEIVNWLYVSPLSVWFFGVFNILKYLNIRYKNYNNIAITKVYKALVSTTIQLCLGFLKPGISGLISAQIISSFIACLCMMKSLFVYKQIKQNVSIVAMKKQAIIYKDFPKFSLWSALANTLVFNLTNLLISAYYSISTLGFYSLVNRVLGMPISVLGSSIGQVFYQQATVEKRETGVVIKSFKSTFKKLLIISVIPFGILYFTIEDLFILVFGESWSVAGAYAKILIPLFSVRFIVSPLSQTNQVNLTNKTGLLFNIILLILTVMILSISHIHRISFIDMIYILSSGQIVFYLSFLLVIYIEVLKMDRTSESS